MKLSLVIFLGLAGFGVAMTRHAGSRLAARFGGSSEVPSLAPLAECVGEGLTLVKDGGGVD